MTVCQPLHFQMGITCVMYQAFYSLTCRFPPETIHWSSKLSPSIFICQPDSITQVGSTFVFLVVTVSPGGPCATCSVSKEVGREGFCFAFRFPVSVWWHTSLQPQLSLHREQARDFTAKKKKKKIDEWLSAEKSQGCVFKVNFLNYEKLLFFMLVYLCCNVRTFKLSF